MKYTKLTPESQQSFLELLPWYVNGTLKSDDRRSMEYCLATYPDCRAELEWMDGVAQQVRGESFPLNEQEGLDRLMSMVRAQESGKLLVLSRPSAPLGGAARQVLGTVSRTKLQQWIKPLMAVAATLAVVQVGLSFIGTQSSDQSETLRPLGTAQPMPRHAMIQATFRADASETKIRALLAQVGAEIVSGPGALGVYTLRVPINKAENALADLRRATTIIDSATQLPQ